jgi:hypothetical protein
MSTETIDHATLSHLVAAGAVDGAHVLGRAGGWSVVIRYGKTERALAAQRSRQVRLFKRMDTLVSYLMDLGIPQFDVDSAEYEPASASRPDRSEALKRTHEAADYDKWFREQVEEAIREADDPNTVWISNEDMEKEWSAMRAELQARIAAGDRK